MTDPITIPAVFKGATPRVDRSYSLKFDTQELPPETVGQLSALHMQSCYLMLAEGKKQLEDVEVPEYQADLETETKTPGQRLRATLFIWWRDNDEPYNNFDIFYREYMMKRINEIKAKLDPREHEN